MRIIVAGTPEVAVPSLEAILAAGHDVPAILTQPDAPTGRGRRLAPSALARRAEELGIPALKPAKVSEAVDDLAALGADAVAVIAYGQLVPGRILAADGPLGGIPWVNLHFSELPRWRGAAPVQRAIMAGDETLGVTCFRLVRELDAGPVYRSQVWPLGARETAGEALDRLARDGAPVLLEALAAVGAGEEPTPQTGEPTLAPKITVDDARLDLARGAVELERLVRGCSPAPGAWTTFRGERFKVLLASATGRELPAGELEIGKREALVGTGTTALSLERVQPVGKKPMTGADWGRGVTLEPGEALGA